MRESPMFVRPEPGPPGWLWPGRIRARVCLAFQGRVCRSGANTRTIAHQSMKRTAHGV